MQFAVKAIAIDLDGTLLHTAPDLAEAANRMLLELKLPVIDEAVVMQFIGNGATKLVKRLLTGDMDGEPEAIALEQAQVIFFRHYAEVLSVRTELYHGVVEGLDNMRQAGFRLACITNKPGRFTVPLLQEMGLFDCFELILSGDSLPKKKPDPMPLLHVCEKFGILPQELVMIGDSAADTEAARAAGCYAFYVPYGYNRGLSADALDVDAVIDSLADVTNLVCMK
ncbi:MAG: phosphoglycolate phosphatase [Candidatus Methylopumilus sp.]|jgi:phosphoglycolate phosphatase